MKPYEELTKRGKLRRLRKLVVKALEHYDLPVKKIGFLLIETNTMFRIQDENGETYVLRIYSDEETTLRENQAEMFWLNAIIRDTHLRVTEPIARRDGEYISVVRIPEVPGERRCALFKWIPGSPMERDLSVDNYHKLGRAMARLHEHAATLNPLPEMIRPKKWNKIFYYPDEPVVYDTREYSHLFPPERIDLLHAVKERADALFERLYADSEDQILIHGDLHYWNVHVYRGELYLIDFEDVMLGYPVQDVAVTLSYGRDREEYDEWREAYQEGYKGVKNWPTESDEDIETLMAARSVMFINYVARIDSAPQQYIENRCIRLRRYLESYG